MVSNGVLTKDSVSNFENDQPVIKLFLQCRFKKKNLGKMFWKHCKKKRRKYW